MHETKKDDRIERENRQFNSHSWRTQYHHTVGWCDSWWCSEQRAWWGWNAWVLNWAWEWAPFSGALWDLKENGGWALPNPMMESEGWAGSVGPTLSGTAVWCPGRDDRRATEPWDGATQHIGSSRLSGSLGLPRELSLQPEEEGAHGLRPHQAPRQLRSRPSVYVCTIHTGQQHSLQEPAPLLLHIRSFEDQTSLGGSLSKI